MGRLGLFSVGGAFLFCCARATVPIGAPTPAPAGRLASGTAPLAEGAAGGIGGAAAWIADAAEDGPGVAASVRAGRDEDALEDAPLEALPDTDSTAGDSSGSAAVDPDATGADAFDPLADDPMALHHDDADGLRALMGRAASVPFAIGGGRWQIGQGNRAISQHAIGRRVCMDHLRDLVLQTPEQQARCGERNMVPVWGRGGSLETARFCIDIFEFPNRACELPFVWVPPYQAARICEAQGKRLCTQDEWNLSCRGDPEGGPDRVYAYGDELDLHVCNTDKSRVGSSPRCDVSTDETTWTTCGTNTEPSGSFPACRSRFGVFDQHGNVAEIMTRYEPADGEVKSQLKGSAFFYIDVAKKPTDPGGYWTRYPDDCNFDPRWHVERIDVAGHVNYHLGFRCCKSLALGDGAAADATGEGGAPYDASAPGDAARE